MKSFDYEAVVIDGEVYCVECAPKTPAEDVVPVFADSEWEEAPACCVCGTVHDYVDVLMAPSQLCECEGCGEVIDDIIERAAELNAAPEADPDWRGRTFLPYKGLTFIIDLYAMHLPENTLEAYVTAQNPHGKTLAIGQTFFPGSARTPEDSAPILRNLARALLVDGMIENLVEQALARFPEELNTVQNAATDERGVTLLN